MATEAPSVEHQELASRVTTLTKSLRRTRLALLAVASFGVVGFLALWARSAPSDSVTAKNFLLVDREGRLSGEWLVRNGVPQFQLLHRGKPGVDLRAGEEPSLTLRDGDQIDRLTPRAQQIADDLGERRDRRDEQARAEALSQNDSSPPNPHP